MYPSNRQRITHRGFLVHCTTLPGFSRVRSECQNGQRCTAPLTEKAGWRGQTARLPTQLIDVHPTLVALRGRESVQGPHAEWS